LQSVRFVKHDIAVERPTQRDQPLIVAIDVKEYEHAPLLGERLSPEEQTLENLARWLAGFGDSREQIVVRFQGESVSAEVVAAPQYGVLGTIRERGSVREEQTGLFTWAFVVSDERVGLYSAKRCCKIETGPVPCPLRLQVSASIDEAKPDSGGRSTATVGLGTKSSDWRQRHCLLKFLNTPASVLAFAHQNDSQLTWRGPLLDVAFKQKLVTIDSRSGRLVEALIEEDGRGQFLRMSSEPAAFQRRLREIDAATSSWTNVVDPRRPLSAALEFLCDDAIDMLTNDKWKGMRESIEAWRKAVAAGLLGAFDHVLVSTAPHDASDFFIPASTEYLAYADDSPEINRFLLSRVVVAHVDRLAPPDSWAWILLREAMFRFAGDSQHFHDQLGRDFARRTSGPLRNLCAALVLRQLEMPIESRVAAQQGLGHLTVDDFHRDCLPLLSADAFLGEWLLRTADALGQMDRADIEKCLGVFVIAGVLEAPEASRLVQALTGLQPRPGRLSAAALPGVLDECWNEVLQKRFRLLLTDLASHIPQTSTLHDE
jgi:hypothetical protein